MRTTRVALAATLLLLVTHTASARPPRAELAGLRLDMSEEGAHESLAHRGKQLAENQHEREGKEERETWSLERGPWRYVSFGLVDGRVRWVTAFVRPKGPRVRYRDLGSLAECRRSGTYFFTWRVPGMDAARPYTVIARGTDSTYVTSVSLVHDPREAIQDRPATPDSGR